jgi:hypothetical protein
MRSTPGEWQGDSPFPPALPRPRSRACGSGSAPVGNTEVAHHSFEERHGPAPRDPGPPAPGSPPTGRPQTGGPGARPPPPSHHPGPWRLPGEAPRPAPGLLEPQWRQGRTGYSQRKQDPGGSSSRAPPPPPFPGRGRAAARCGDRPGSGGAPPPPLRASTTPTRPQLLPPLPQPSLGPSRDGARSGVAPKREQPRGSRGPEPEPVGCAGRPDTRTGPVSLRHTCPRGWTGAPGGSVGVRAWRSAAKPGARAFRGWSVTELQWATGAGSVPSLPRRPAEDPDAPCPAKLTCRRFPTGQALH